jgi:hypothetical protein
MQGGVRRGPPDFETICSEKSVGLISGSLSCGMMAYATSIPGFSVLALTLYFANDIH